MAPFNTENIDIEYKQEYVEDIRKEIIAFANTEGGEIYVGIADDDAVVGVDDPDEVMLKITSIINDSIRPNLVPFVDVRTIDKDSKKVVKVTVSIGSERPYYWYKKGLKPEGVFIRRGSAVLPLSNEGIRKMIADSYGDSFEEARCVNQDLTFNTFNEELVERGIKADSAEKLRNLCIVGDDGLYTNLGYLMSDQCVSTIKVAVFQGLTKGDFIDRKEFSGSVLKQLEDCYTYISLMNKTNASFEGLKRIDRRDYPEVAIREALLNTVVHRDYSVGGSTIINIFDDHIEFVSLGGLVADLSMEAIMAGASLSRNPKLANIFYRMRLIESYGTGIQKIEELYSSFSRKPEFTAPKGAFKVALYNMNYGNSIKQVTVVKDIQDEHKIILDEIDKRGSITRKEVESLLGVGQTKAYNLLNKLVTAGEIRTVSAGKLTTYTK